MADTLKKKPEELFISRQCHTGIHRNNANVLEYKPKLNNDDILGKKGETRYYTDLQCPDIRVKDFSTSLANYPV